MRAVHILLVACAFALPVASALAKTKPVDRTDVNLPTTLGRLHLVDAEVVPNSKPPAIRANYTVDGAKDVKVDVYMLTGWREEAYRQAPWRYLGAFQAQLKATYPDLLASSPTSARIDTPKSFLDAGDAPVSNEPPLQGADQAFTFTDGGKKEVLIATYFYRHLSVMRVVVVAPEGQMTHPQFRALNDEIARSLLPAIDIRNFGSCGNDKEAVDPKDPYHHEPRTQYPRKDNCSISPSHQPVPPPKGGKTFTVVHSG